MIKSQSVLYSVETREVVGGIPAVPRKLISILWDWQTPYDTPFYIRYNSAAVRNVLHKGGGECYVKVMSSSAERALDIAMYHYCFGHDHTIVALPSVPVEIRGPLLEM